MRGKTASPARSHPARCTPSFAAPEDISPAGEIVGESDQEGDLAVARLAPRAAIGRGSPG